MTSITIRQLPEPTKEKLRLRAARSGLSLEAYLRKVLQAASEADPLMPPNIAELSQACFGEKNGIDLDIPPRGKDRKPVRFD